MEPQSNRLIHEKSPYLLQHAHNPVDWYPWNDEAFEKAAREGKPIFLSIGYSTCHWCHVMEKESFEDPEVAALMNEVFVSVKVDREERPDLDHVYMAVCQILGGRGGWPLTIIMTPDKRPFFAATYIPREKRYGQTGMLELIPRIGDIWKSRRKEVLASAAGIHSALKEMEKDMPGQDLDVAVLDAAYAEFENRYDKAYGGFSPAPKFPTPHNLLFLLRYWRRTGNTEALKMVEKTIRHIRWGGVYDHIGFGLHRYSTDREWLIPHFEKMLYDQSMFALACLETYQATGKRLYERTAREIFRYVLRDLRSPEGGFYSAEDADSEGREGKFYVWEEREIRDVLADDDADLAIRVFRVEKEGNFRDEATGRNTGHNILHTGRALTEIADELGISPAELTKKIDSIREILFDIRSSRVHPHKDDKILTDWNGLMIAALARGAQILGDPLYRSAAEDGARFILDQLRTNGGRLLHRYRDGESGIEAHLDDYSFFIWALIELYESTFESFYLKTALELNEEMIHHFWDQKAGGLFFTPDDGETLLMRKKEVYDGATPSGNGVAFQNLLHLARLTADSALEEKAFTLMRNFSGQIRQFPSGYTHFLCSVDFLVGPSFEVIIVGPPGAEETNAMIHALRSCYLPNRVTLFRSSVESSGAIDEVAEFAKQYTAIEGKATAYVCTAHACSAATTDPAEMLNRIAHC